MTSRVAMLGLGLVAVVAAAYTTAAAPAQTNGPPNALQGFSQNRDKPIKIDAATLEVRDKKKTATFSGNVVVVQGDTTLRCKSLEVFYDDDGTTSTASIGLPKAGGRQRIRRLEARGGVVIVQKEQTATGETGVFDMALNTLTLSGNVVMSQGQNVLRGQSLMVDLVSGVSRVDSGKSSTGRVQGLFLPSSAPQMGRTTQDAKQEAPREPSRSPPMRPGGLY